VNFFLPVPEVAGSYLRSFKTLSGEVKVPRISLELAVDFGLKRPRNHPSQALGRRVDDPEYYTYIDLESILAKWE
jgi:hypothetical protein